MLFFFVQILGTQEMKNWTLRLGVTWLKKRILQNPSEKKERKKEARNDMTVDTD
jgi:hypothetical protein